MANDNFEFKQFKVHQEHCAMKVGTDGTLLGAWAEVPCNSTHLRHPMTTSSSSPTCLRILDIGTGTGLIALMMAQRFPEAEVLGIDIDPDAVAQAQENVLASPFTDRIVILNQDIVKMHDTFGFDAIVCNPPYFINSLTCPGDKRTTARHMVSLTYDELMTSAFQQLNDDGFFSIVIPSDCRPAVEAAACLAGFFMSRICLIRTTPTKSIKRQLIEFRKHPVYDIVITEEVVEVSPNVRSTWYKQLTNDFYIK